MALCKFLNEIKTHKLQSRLSEEEKDDIEKGVTKYITILTEKAAEKETLLTVKQFIKVGSFYEKTKLGDPDEFDFLIELEGNFKPEHGCHGNPCSSHVKDNGLHISDKDYGMVVQGFIASQPVFFKFQSIIKSFMMAALNKENELQVLYGIFGQLTAFPALKGCGPNTEIHLNWERYKSPEEDPPYSFGISIDISVCLACPDSLLHYWEEHIATNNYKIGANQLPRPILVVPSRSRMQLCKLGHSYDTHVCWRISFAPIEVHLMKNLPESHRATYCILKLLCKQTENPSSEGLGHDPVLNSLSSYMLKNAILHHNDNCDGDKDVKCLKATIDYLLQCCEQMFLPAFFFPTLNLWKSHSESGEIKPPARILTRLRHFLFDEINSKPEEEVVLKDMWWDVLYMQKFFGDYESEDFRVFSKPLELPRKYPPPSVFVKHQND